MTRLIGNLATIFSMTPFMVVINTVMAGIVVLTLFAFVLDGLVGRVEKSLMKWQPKCKQPKNTG
jgi:ABC-type nitrate/sulfonate/bicarbonate transport system permease component